MTDWTGYIDVLGFGAAIISAFGLLLRHVLRRADQQARDYRHLVENHLAHNTEALIELRNTLQRLNDTLRNSQFPPAAP